MKDSTSFKCLFPSHQFKIEYFLMWGRHGCEIKKATVILPSEGKKMSVLMLLAIKVKGIHPTLCPSLSKLELMISHCGYINSNMVQFSRSVMSNSLQPHESQHARAPCPSPTPEVHSNSCPSSQWCHPAISSSVVPFSVPFSSCPQPPPSKYGKWY